MEQPKIKKPWGGYTILKKNQSSWIKKLFVNKGSRTSLQSHKLRNEIWFVLNGNIIAEIGNKKHKAKSGNILLIPKKMQHRLIGSSNACVLEIAFGKVLERDIIRYQDDYGRI